MQPQQIQIRTAFVVTFRVGRQRYALPLSAVLQVVRLPALTIVPDAPRTLCGLLNLKGDFVPVLNGRAILSEQPAIDLDNQIIILGTDSGAPAVGLLVDEVDMVRSFAPGSFAALASNNAIVVGMLHEQDDAAMLLDPKALAALGTYL